MRGGVQLVCGEEGEAGIKYHWGTGGIIQIAREQGHILSHITS